jgi:hypothetical protein
MATLTCWPGRAPAQNRRWGRPSASRRRPLGVEVLEDRLLLSVSPAPSAQVQATVASTGLATITGTVYQDHAGSGQYTSTDTGIAGRTVFLDLHHDGKLDSGDPYTVTGANGSFVFKNLAPGTYTVCQVVPPGWTATTYLVATNVPPATSPADQLIGLDKFRADPQFAGITGQGESVVVLDTGIDSSNSFFGPDSNHDGVANSIIYQHDFTTGSNTAPDPNGHGTYVASIIASRDTTYPGIAPGVNLIVLKVLNDKGQGEFQYVDQALQWVIANQAKYHIAVVNMSFGDGGDYTTPQSMYGIGNDLATLAADNVIVVAAAGNNDSPTATPGLAYPAIDPNTIAVGAVWDANHGGPWVWDNNTTDYTTAAGNIVSFSQRLPGSGEVFAPGTLMPGAAPGGGTSSLSGTSTATAVVSGVVALGQQLAMQDLGHPLSLAQIRNLLNSTGPAIRDGENENDNVTHTGAIFHMVNIYSLAQAIVAMGSVSPGPNADSRTVTLPAGSTVPVALGSFQEGTVSGVVFADPSGGGKYASTDTLLADRTVFADLAGTGQYEPGDPYARTNSLGQYTLTGLPPGPATIRIDLLNNERQTTPEQLTVTSGLTETSVDLGIHTDPLHPAPTLSGNGANQTIPEGSTNPSGLNVFTVLGKTFHDVNPSSPSGIAIVGVNSAQGQWQFSSDGGLTWRSIGPVSIADARLLTSLDRLRFVPAGNFSGTATITYYAWDQSVGAPGQMIDLTTGTGGSTGFSATTATASAIVTYVHHAPVLNGPGWITPVTPGVSNPQGNEVMNILTGTVTLDPGGKAGLALIGSTGSGTWQFSEDGGKSWSNLGTVSYAQARLLADTARIRFLPAPGWNGSASITYRAWDESTGVAGSVINLTNWALTGGTTAFSKQVQSAYLTPTSSGGGPTVALS